MSEKERAERAKALRDIYGVDTSDIVERLRALDGCDWQKGGCNVLKDEAAAEIERLKRELEKAHRLLSQFAGWQRDAEIVKAKQGQEIERLQAALQYARNLVGPDEIIDAALERKP